MKNKETTKEQGNFLLRLTKEERKKLKFIAVDKDISMNNLICNILNDYLRQNK